MDEIGLKPRPAQGALRCALPRAARHGSERPAHTEGLENLLHAHRASLEGGSARWGAIWAVRLAQNAVRARRLAAAEGYLLTGLSLSPHLTLAGEAVLARVVSEVHLAAQRWAEAAAWLVKARQIGEERAMSHQLRCVRELEVRLESGRR